MDYINPIQISKLRQYIYDEEFDTESITFEGADGNIALNVDQELSKKLWNFVQTNDSMYTQQITLHDKLHPITLYNIQSNLRHFMLDIPFIIGIIIKTVQNRIIIIIGIFIIILVIHHHNYSLNRNIKHLKRK